MISYFTLSIFNVFLRFVMWSDTNEDMNSLTVLSKQQANCSLYLVHRGGGEWSLWWDQKFCAILIPLAVIHQKDAVLKTNNNKKYPEG